MPQVISSEKINQTDAHAFITGSMGIFLAEKLQCSTKPIFTCYENMDELKKEFLAYAYEFYEQYVEKYASSVHVSSYLIRPLSYIEFARKETYLFNLLFIKDMDLKVTEEKTFTKKPTMRKERRFLQKLLAWILSMRR